MVKNLEGKLAYYHEDDIRNIFKSFGNILNIEMEFDKTTKKNMGHAIV